MNLTLSRIAPLAGLLLLCSTCFAEEAKKVIPDDEFYKMALRDEKKIASFESVAAALRDGGVILLDVRSPREFQRSHVVGAISLPTTELTDEALRKIMPSKQSRIVIYCANNFRPSRMVSLTTMAYPAIKRLGYNNVAILETNYKDISPLAFSDDID
ncbi:rhodanese-related sulfurtransferase [Oxalobacteraceae bacterium GrIS 1.11]